MKYRMRHVDTFEMSDMEVYTLVLTSSSTPYPSGFWNGVDGYVKAKKIFKYVIEDILKWSLEDIKQKTKTEIIDEYKLRSMLDNVFNGSIYIAIGETFPELKDWADNEYEKHDTGQVSRYTDGQLINILKDKAKKLNRLPKGVDMKNPSYIVYTNRFGSWEKALIEAELIEDIFKDIDFKSHTREKVIQNLKDLFADKERVLEKSEILDIYPEGIIKEYFGTYNKIEKAIINSYSKEELIQILKNKKERISRIPNNKDMVFPKAIVFIDKFGSWQNAIEKID